MTWRGSKLPVPEVAGLRPTPDRVRETLFNWLAPRIRQSRVLDCCAGSGALGLEAASRGAISVTLVESDAAAAALLRSSTRRLQADRVTVQRAQIEDFLLQEQLGFDLVFVDPPYAARELRDEILGLLIDRQLLNPGAWIYLEWPQQERFELPHTGLTWIKQKSAGAICFAVAQWQ